MPIGYCWEGNNLLLDLHIQPRASKDEWAGEYGDNALKLRITAPPVDGKANVHLEKFLAGEFGVKRSDVVLLSGTTGRRKRFRITAPATLPSAIKPAGEA
jgi:hypothetical protein